MSNALEQFSRETLKEKDLMLMTHVVCGYPSFEDNWKMLELMEENGADIVDFKEKPISRSHVNAGVYVLSPEALDGLEKNVKCDMPNVFDRLAKKNQRIVAFPMHEPWLDVGNARDLDEASKAITKKESAD